MRKTTVLNLSQFSRPDTQISILARMTVGNKSNNDAYEVLSHFVWRYSVLVCQCVLSGNVNNLRDISCRWHVPIPLGFIITWQQFALVQISSKNINTPLREVSNTSYPHKPPKR